MHLSDKQREKAFPVHIELGRKEGAMGGAMAVPMSPSGKKGKPRTYYPTVYIDSMPGLEALPEEGCMLVHYRRTRLNIDTPEDGETTAGVTLELRRICLAEDAEEDGYAPDTLESVLEKADRKPKKTDDENGGR